MDVAVVVVGLYGLFTVVGGVIGYVKAKSAASLVAGVVSGMILLTCAAGMRHASAAATLASGLVALLLGARFTSTWIRRRRVMPDLLMVIGSLAVLITVGMKWLVK